MPSLDELWTEYQHRRRPPSIGATVAGVRLGHLDDDVQDVLGSWGMGPALGVQRVAQLGLALADLERVLPEIPTGETHEYLLLLAALARAALEWLREHGDPPANALVDSDELEA